MEEKKILKNGILITFEGTDGSGKSTQVKALGDRLEAEGYIVRRYKFPTYGVSGKLAYAYLNQEIDSENLDAYQASALYLVDMMCYSNEINSALKRGEVVLVDRYVGSNFYQQAVRSFDSTNFDFPVKLRDFIYEIKSMAYHKLKIPKPEITFFMEVSSAFSKLIRERDQTRTTKDFHEKDEEYLRKVAVTGSMAASIAEWTCIPCDFRPIEEISEDIYNKLMEEFSKNETFYFN